MNAFKEGCRLWDDMLCLASLPRDRIHALLAMLFLALMVHALALFSVMVFFPRVRGIDYTFFRGVIDKNAHLPAVASARRSLQPGTGPSALVKPVPFWGLRA
ncbi:MAG: hypothetical protein FJX76_13490 [Armatimonadetes bacterium]|nr:hypothetical protein [Armatimonadota bacterium]